ncbi:hypothetical protein [Camelimonas lactis]|uniref:Uncharacterized protein n=1 Tax=Camelimonas lactis TaxID=659006 RepID=A0A4R2GQY2_9HYPH|nr:hypothetical protein [Camelimonas lactis]TCO12362.1 hypothetical protein EV666_1097 [Camelimonas lactis]
MTNNPGPATTTLVAQIQDLRRRAATKLEAPHIGPTDEDRHDIEQQRAREAQDVSQNHSR